MDKKHQNKAFTPLEIMGYKERQAKSRKFLRGFTLIELLVVIAIIGLLATIVTVSVNSARIKARDTKRIADLKQLSSALALYYDTTGHYPIGGWYASCWGSGNWIGDNGNYNWSTSYLSTQPHDPVDTCIWPWDGANPTPSATYAYWSDNGTRFALVARLENANNKSTIQNANTPWFDGNSLYSYHGWYARAYALLSY